MVEPFLIFKKKKFTPLYNIIIYTGDGNRLVYIYIKPRVETPTLATHTSHAFIWVVGIALVVGVLGIAKPRWNWVAFSIFLGKLELGRPFRFERELEFPKRVFGF